MRKIGRWQRSFTLEGLNVERFVRLAGERRIPLTALRRSGARRLTGRVCEQELPRLTQLAADGGWQLVPGARHGAGRVLQWCRTRWLLCLGMLTGALLLTAASCVVWRIEIVDAGVYAADIQTALAELGVRVPAWRWDVDVGQLSEALAWRYPRVAWVECGLRGVTLVIRSVEGVLPKTGEASGVCDVVAARDAIVYSVVTRSGTAVVQPGAIVRAGEVLIRAEERTSDGLTRPVAADGQVLGRVWLGTEVQMSATEITTRHTGNVQTVWTVRTPWFDLWPMPDCPYEHADIAVTEIPLGGFLLPCVLHVETRLEAEFIREKRDLAALMADAEAAARRRLLEKAGENESFIDIWGNCSMIDDENVSACAIGEMLVDVGVRVPSGMAVPE